MPKHPRASPQALDENKDGVCTTIEDFPELIINTKPVQRGDIHEKNNEINIRGVIAPVRGNPCTREGVTQPGIRLAALCKCIPEDKYFIPGYLQIKGMVGFANGRFR